MIYTQNDIAGFDRRYRTNFINSISGFKSANLIGTVDRSGKTNLAVFSSVIHLGSDPASLGFLMRPVSAERHTYANIKETGYFTVNNIHKSIIHQAHQTSARYDKDISEFDACCLTAEITQTICAPYVLESQIKIGCKFIEEHIIQFNGTVFMAGEIMEVILTDTVLMNDGYVDIESAGTVAISGIDGYNDVKNICRFSYAKPEKPLTPF